ncbi:MAG: outer membrane beta-barrel protein, partial [Rhizobacter sp.]|nr:outer membrane beta-barrel protein [Chlorobiales bacterium]
AARYKFTPQWSGAVRGEVFQDGDGILTGNVNTSGNTDNDSGLKAFGVTLGVDYRPLELAFIRLEGRYLGTDANQKIFLNGNEASTSRIELIFTTGVVF